MEGDKTLKLLEEGSCIALLCACVHANALQYTMLHILVRKASIWQHWLCHWKGLTNCTWTSRSIAVGSEKLYVSTLEFWDKCTQNRARFPDAESCLPNQQCGYSTLNKCILRKKKLQKTTTIWCPIVTVCMKTEIIDATNLVRPISILTPTVAHWEESQGSTFI